MPRQRKVLMESETKELASAVVLVLPAIIFAYYTAPRGFWHSVDAFVVLVCSGFCILLLHYRNKLVLFNDGLSIIDATLSVPVELSYKDIVDARLRLGLVELFTMSKVLVITDVKGKVYVLRSIANGEELLEVIYDNMRLFYDNVDIY